MLWDTRTWRPFGQPVTGDRAVGWLTFSADGRALRVFFEDQHVVQVSTSPRDWVTAACRASRSQPHTSRVRRVSCTADRASHLP